MPQVEGGPQELNDLLERAYNNCMKYSQDESKCSATAWSVAEKQGWHKGPNGWVKGHQMEEPIVVLEPPRKKSQNVITRYEGDDK